MITKLLGISTCFLAFATITCDAGLRDRNRLKMEYYSHCKNYSDIHEHLPILKQLSQECTHVTEIGMRDMNSTWGILEGLAQRSDKKGQYVGIDINRPPAEILNLATQLAIANEIDFRFIRANDMEIDISPTDLLFIDTLHTYCHLTYELEKFSPKASKYIALHDTDHPWGFIDDDAYHGDQSEYPEGINRTKRGLWQAVQDFLEIHPEWSLHMHRTNNHGFTVLKRVIN